MPVTSKRDAHSMSTLGGRGGGGGTVPVAAKEPCLDGPGVPAFDGGLGLERVTMPNVLFIASASSTSTGSLSVSTSEGAIEARSGSDLPASIACSLAVVRMSSCCVSSMYSLGGFGASGGGGGIALFGN